MKESDSCLYQILVSMPPTKKSDLLLKIGKELRLPPPVAVLIPQSESEENMMLYRIAGELGIFRQNVYETI